MIVSLGLVALALFILLLLLYLDGGQSSMVGSIEDLSGRTRPVDIAAFRNLTDRREDEFLRAALAPREFRAIQRKRTRAALDYIRNTTVNAGLLLRLGEAAARSTDPRIAVAGRQLMESALRLRGYALLCTINLYLRLAMPGSRFSVRKVADKYQRLSGLASQLAFMQHPAQAARLSALL